MSNQFTTISRNLGNMLVRAVVKLSHPAQKCQALDLQLLAGEQKDNIEHLEPYGFTSSPISGSEAFAAFPDGDRSHGVVLVVADRRYRITGLAAGEVAIYSDEGDSIILKRGNHIEVNSQQVTINASNKASFITPQVEISGQLKVQGNIQSSANIQDKTGTMAAMRGTYNKHNHPHGEPNSGQPNQPME